MAVLVPAVFGNLDGGAMNAQPRLYAVGAAQEPDAPTLLLPAETAYVTETPTGLLFAPNTPLEVWASLTTRLIVARQRIGFSLADAINFGRDRYGEMYAQWVDETGLQETTLMNVAWVGREVPVSRRREGVDFTYHQAVAALVPEKQDELLDKAVENGWRRFELREAVKAEQEKLRGRAVNADGGPTCAEELAWSPTIDELTDEARAALEANAPGGRHRIGYVAGFIRGLMYAHQEDAFKEWRA